MAELPTRYGKAPHFAGPTRTSTHIRRKPASNLHHAIRVAASLGLPLNLFVTLNFSEAGCQPENVSLKFSTLRERYFCRWLRDCRRGKPRIPPTFVWVLEAKGGCLAAHWLIHIPAVLQSKFTSLLPRWLATIANLASDPSVTIHVRSAPTPKGAGRYMLKGMEPTMAVAYGVRHEPQGIVQGKRSGFSRNLGPAARRRHGYKPRPFRWYPHSSAATPTTPTVNPASIWQS
jgi:hypothetical protein